MGRLTDEQKAKIVRLRDPNTNISEIARILVKDGCPIRRLSVRLFLRRFQERQSFANAPPPSRPSETVTPEIMNFTDTQMERNDKLTSPTLRQKIRNEFGVDFSESTIKRLRKKLLWMQTGTKYCQLIKEVNHDKRLAFCLRCMENNDQFDDVTFTD